MKQSNNVPPCVCSKIDSYTVCSEHQRRRFKDPIIPQMFRAIQLQTEWTCTSCGKTFQPGEPRCDCHGAK